MLRLVSKYPVLVAVAVFVCIAGLGLQAAPLKGEPAGPLQDGSAAGGLQQVVVSRFSTGSAAAQITSLWPVYDARTKGAATLWAQVQNTGTDAMPADATVWFWVAPAESGSGDWACSASVAGLAAGDTKWYSAQWGIPDSVTPGNYKYWARTYVKSDATSEWAGPQDFPVETGIIAAEIVSLWPVTGAGTGGSAKLWAQVKNTGNVSLPSVDTVWFLVSGLGNPWVGSGKIGGLAAGATDWYSFTWDISVELPPGAYKYSAQAFGAGGAISKLSDPQSFEIKGGGAVLAHVVSLKPVDGAVIGGQSALWVQIKNIGSASFPGTTLAYFYVGDLANPWIGYVSVGGLAQGATAWYSFSWDIARSVQSGTYTYWVRVYREKVPLSDWSSGQQFTIAAPKDIEAQVIKVNPVTDAYVGGKATLSALVRNVGKVPLPANAVVSFNVESLSAPMVGSVSVAGLVVDGTKLFSYKWDIPQTVKPGDYTYRAQIYAGDSTPLSQASSAQPFTISPGTDSGFDETFDSGTASRWIQDYGAWTIRSVGGSSGWYYASGVANSLVTSTFNAEYTSFDYSARLFRYGSERNQPAFLEVRATGAAIGQSNAILNGYRFQYTPDGRFSVWKTMNGTNSALVEAKPTSAIVGGDFNVLRVKAIGTNFWFYINDVLVWSGTEPSLPKGRVGVGFFSPTGNAGEDLFVDWAKLSANPAPPTAIEAQIMK